MTKPTKEQIDAAIIALLGETTAQIFGDDLHERMRCVLEAYEASSESTETYYVAIARNDKGERAVFMRGDWGDDWHADRGWHLAEKWAAARFDNIETLRRRAYNNEHMERINEIDPLTIRIEKHTIITRHTIEDM